MTTNGTNGTNGASPRPKKLSPGVYCPTVTFFRATPGQELDLELNARHFEKLARAGLHGIVVQGSTAEAVSLTPEERKQVSAEPNLVVDLLQYIWPTCSVAMR
jgi:dihydrodipicolinate synthase/N-acetylneuraminate lyase